MKIKTRTIENEIARQGLTYKETASRAGITERTLKAARLGARIQPATAGRIAAALGLDAAEIVITDITHREQNE